MSVPTEARIREIFLYVDWLIPSGFPSALFSRCSKTFAIDIAATFSEPGLYTVEIAVDGEPIDLPLLEVLHSPAGDDLVPEFFTGDE
jgi:hypothetical protein